MEICLENVNMCIWVIKGVMSGFMRVLASFKDLMGVELGLSISKL